MRDDSEPMTYRRPYLKPDGSVRDVYLPACKCGEARRGPSGGVCGNCGDAIPDAPCERKPTRKGQG
jgi:hypothetical protein